MVATNVLREAAVPTHASPWKAGAAAAALAVAVNTALYAAAVAAGVFPTLGFVPRGEEMALGPVVLVSAAGALAGTAVYAWMRRSGQPFSAFVAVAAVVLVISLAGPFTVPGLTGAMVWVLEAMHVVVAAITLTVLYRWDAYHPQR